MRVDTLAPRRLLATVRNTFIDRETPGALDSTPRTNRTIASRNIVVATPANAFLSARYRVFDRLPTCWVATSSGMTRRHSFCIFFIELAISWPVVARSPARFASGRSVTLGHEKQAPHIITISSYHSHGQLQPISGRFAGNLTCCIFRTYGLGSASWISWRLCPAMHVCRTVKSPAGCLRSIFAVR